MGGHRVLNGYLKNYHSCNNKNVYYVTKIKKASNVNNIFLSQYYENSTIRDWTVKNQMEGVPYFCGKSKSEIWILIVKHLIYSWFLPS